MAKRSPPKTWRVVLRLCFYASRRPYWTDACGSRDVFRLYSTHRPYWTDVCFDSTPPVVHTDYEIYWKKNIVVKRISNIYFTPLCNHYGTTCERNLVYCKLSTSNLYLFYFLFWSLKTSKLSPECVLCIPLHAVTVSAFSNCTKSCADFRRWIVQHAGLVPAYGMMNLTCKATRSKSSCFITLIVTSREHNDTDVASAWFVYEIVFLTFPWYCMTAFHLYCKMPLAAGYY